MSDIQSVEAPPGELLLDPFSYQPGMGSAVTGLGGATPHVDPTYVFHTDYVSAAEGPCYFTVRFEALSAKLGTLQLRVHMLIDGDVPRLILSNSLRIQFNRLVHEGGEVAIRFDGFRGVRFALYGTILGQSDARATGLSVALDRPAGSVDEDRPAVELSNTRFGQDATRAEPALLTLAPPTLAVPVSQPATAAQLREPAARDWLPGPAAQRLPPRTRWMTAYVLQVLKAYGMLQPGATGLGLGEQPGPVAEGAEAAGARCRTAPLPADPEALPGPLVNFDFLWTVDLLGRDGVGGAPALAEATMRCLRPGGLAVHVLPFRPGLDQRLPDSIDTGGAHVFHRGEVERLAVIMISRKFETAQLKIICADPLLGPVAGLREEAGAFGLVFRKPAIAGV